MTEVLVLGGGMVGLSTASLLARDGHHVTVLERDPEPPPSTVEEIWGGWERRGVTQFHQAHYFQPRMTAELTRELPEVLAAAESLGALRSNVISWAGPLNGIEWQPGDEQFDIVTARRPVMEASVAQVAAATPGVDVRRGVAVAGLLTGERASDGTPHVTGARTGSGQEFTADVVIDAGGRRSALPRWLGDIDAAAPAEEREEFGFTYFGQYFQGDAIPEYRAQVLTTYGAVSILALPADNNTWVIAFVGLSGDAPMRALMDRDTFARTLAAFPLLAHWGDAEPVGDVQMMAKLEDRITRLVVDGSPVATGILPVGDSWACSNPSLGRGATIGFLHAVTLRDTLRDHDGDATALSLAFDRATAERVQPWYDATLGVDRERRREIEAAIAGEEYGPSDPGVEIGAAFRRVADIDPDTYRSFQTVACMLAPVGEVVARPGVLDRVFELGADWRDHPTPGPSRPEFLDLLAG